MAAKPILLIQNISKHFGGVHALSDVSFDVTEGECHALVGENGAGKTTLINILNGAFPPDSGSFQFLGQEYLHSDPLTSIQRGLNVIHQEVALVDTLTVMENIFLHSLEGKTSFFVKSKTDLKNEARKILNSLGCDIEPDEIIEELSTSKKQIVEIAKALASDPRLLIMDEPTSALTQGETEKLFQMIDMLKGRGISIIFVSHRLNEVKEISDRVTVLRDGKYIGTVETAETEIPEIVKMMVGREVELYQMLSEHEGKKEKVLEIVNLSHRNYFRNVSFYARKGEILGFSGLVGAGRTELVQTIFGFLESESGTIKINGKIRKITKPKEAMRYGIGMLPEDRKVAAAIGTMSVRENTSIAILPTLTRLLFVNKKREKSIVNDLVDKLRIKTANIEESILNLSGGNQQKVMLARWLASDVEILIVDEPTQGVDVGAKAEIHRLLRNLASEGVAVIVISSDLPEVQSISDRIIVMRNGEIAGEMDSADATPERIMTLATVGVQSSQVQ